MDLITHGVTGALLARAAFEGEAREAATAALTLGALFPDFDVALLLRGRYAYLTGHRGITHSIAGIPLFAPAVAGLLHVFGPPAGFGFYLALVLLGMMLHVFYDLITSWGTMILAPFTDRKFSWALISFRNYPFVFTLWISLAVSFFLDAAWSRALCGAAMATSLGTIVVASISKRIARRRFEAALARDGIRAEKIEGFPAGSRILAWSMFAESGGAFWHGFVRLVPAGSITLRSMSKPPENEFTEVAAALPPVRFYLDVTSFVRRAYHQEGNLHVVTFSNARFDFRQRPSRGMVPGEGARVVFDEALRVKEAVVYGIPVPIAGWTASG